jgi:DNA-binding CsgD family transcriptional regulator
MMLSARFRADAEEIRDGLRDYWRECAEEERRILADPLRHAPIKVEMFAQQAEHYRALIMARFGIDAADPRRDIENMAPLHVNGVDVLNLFTWGARYGGARDSYLVTRGYARDSEVEARFVCSVWMRHMRFEPVTLLMVMELVRMALEEKWKDTRHIPRVFGEAIAAGVTGICASRISLLTNRRLRDALERERCDLLEQLPAEAIAAWDERKPGDGIEVLVSTAANRVEKVLALLREPKHVADVEDVGDTEDDLAEFERLETLRQQSRQLDALEHRAGLSLREEQVYRRLRQNMQPEAIAADLGITRNNVYQVKRNALKKLEAARMSAGL